MVQVECIPGRTVGERMTVLEAEKGYDADRLRQALLTVGIFPLIPYRKIRGREIPEIDGRRFAEHLACRENVGWWRDLLPV